MKKLFVKKRVKFVASMKADCVHSVSGVCRKYKNIGVYGWLY